MAHETKTLKEDVLEDYCCYCECNDCQTITQKNPIKAHQNCQHCNLKEAKNDNKRTIMINHEPSSSSTICSQQQTIEDQIKYIDRIIKVFFRFKPFLFL